MSRRPHRPAFPAPERSACGQGYERMRRHAVEPGAAHDRHGSAVVALRGVAAWVHAFSELPVPPETAAMSASSGPLPAGIETSAIDILVAMLGGRHARRNAA